MPGKKQFKEQADEGMMRACYDLIADMALGAGALVSMTMIRTSRKGVFVLVAMACPDEKVWRSGGNITYRVEWPKSEVATLAGAWFRAVNKLDVMVGEAIGMGDWESVAGPWEP